MKKIKKNKVKEEEIAISSDKNRLMLLKRQKNEKKFRDHFSWPKFPTRFSEISESHSHRFDKRLIHP